MNARIANRRRGIERVIAALAAMAAGVALATVTLATVTLATVTPATVVLAETPSTGDSIEKDFTSPPAKWKSRPLWFWNGSLDKNTTTAIMEKSVASGYYGFGILPTADMGVAFMSPEFLRHYKHAVDTASRLGLKMCLYDEFWFPSGSAGGLLKEHYPAARNAMFGLRAELFSNGFVKTLADWCRDHDIELTGHLDQEEIVNPVGLCGDLRWNPHTGRIEPCPATNSAEGTAIELQLDPVSSVFVVGK